MHQNLLPSRLAATLVVVALLLTSVSSVAAVFTRPESGAQSTSLAVKAANLPELIQKAQADGSLPVIVMLAVPFQAENQLSSAEAVDTQRAVLLQTQDGLLTSLPGVDPASVKKYTFIPAMAFSVDAADLAALAADPRVSHIEEDQLDRVELAESVPLIGAPAVWNSGYSGAGQVVAILDTGVDKNHTFLAGKVVSEACYSSNNSSDGASTICPGGATSSTAVNSALPYASGVCPAGECDHGTHVSGITAGKDPGGVGLNGVAKDAHLIAIQVFSKFSAAACGGSECVMSYTSDEISGLNRVYNLRSTYNIASVNMSLGGGTDYTSQSDCDTNNSAIKAAIDTLRGVGIATVIASGNWGWSDGMSAPGCISSAISVGSTQDGSYSTSADTISFFSNSASFLSLLAPGEWITSSVPGGSENLYDTYRGTSMATPHVAGAWAVMKSKFPTASVDQILADLKMTGKAIKDSRNNVTTSRIRLDQAALTYSISGKVTVGTSGGAGLAGVTISDGLGDSTLTAANGTYTLSGLMPGTYTLTPSLGANVFTPAVSATQTVGPSKTNINFIATPYTISGKVTVGTSGGAGLGGVTISDGVGHTTITAANGTYTLSNLPAGAYTLTPSLGANIFVPAASTPVTVGPNQANVNFVATTFSISGKVTIGTTGGIGLAGVTINGGSGHTTTTAADGTYTLGGLLAGSYTLTPSLSPNTFTPANSGAVIVGPDKTDINFVATAYSIAGKVTIATGAGAGLAGVTINDNKGHSTITAADGTYTLGGLLPGAYILTPSLGANVFSPASSASVSVGPNKTGTNFIAQVYSIAGKVTVDTAGGVGLVGVTVTADASHTASTDASGNYTITGLLAGTYGVTPTKTGYAFNPFNNPVTVGPNKTGISFIASAAIYSISGKVTLGASGLAGVTVSDGAGHTAITDGSGNYTLSSLANGSYTLHLSKPKYTFTSLTAMPVIIGPSATGIDFSATLLPLDTFLPVLIK